MESIIIRGAREHNLKNIDVVVPRTTSRNPRSTVGTVTEIYDYLRLLYASIGVPHCTNCGQEIRAQTIQQMVDKLMALAAGTKFTILAPYVRGKKGEYRKQMMQMVKEGFTRAVF